jgi:hypothetical protein
MHTEGVKGCPGSRKPAEGVGFEPTGTCIPRLFKSLAASRSGSMKGV